MLRLKSAGFRVRQMLVPLDVWRRCSREPLPEREGPCFVGFDLGGSTSMTAGAAYWPEVGRLQVWGAFGNEPGLSARGEADGVGLRYERMAARGELRTWPGRVTPVAVGSPGRSPETGPPTGSGGCIRRPPAAWKRR